MNYFIFLLLVLSSWSFASVIDEQLDLLNAQMQKALDVQNLNDNNISKKMKEISEGLSAKDLEQLNKPINTPPSGMSQEEFRRINNLVQQELSRNGISAEDLDLLKRKISDLIQ